ncbi:MAG: hypothetical protein ACRDCN_00535 [Tannerellaceae bacterium]
MPALGGIIGLISEFLFFVVFANSLFDAEAAVIVLAKTIKLRLLLGDLYIFFVAGMGSVYLIAFCLQMPMQFMQTTQREASIFLEILFIHCDLQYVSHKPHWEHLFLLIIGRITAFFEIMPRSVPTGHIVLHIRRPRNVTVMAMIRNTVNVKIKE